MEEFMRKYSFLITSVTGVCALICLIFGWNRMTMVQRLPVMYIIALAIHEIEELKLPGGFVELVTAMTGVTIRNIGMAKFGLLLFTLYATIIPALLASCIWPVMATLFIGIIEVFAHLAAARVNTERFYSPGMLTALFVQFPVAAFGYYDLISNGLIHGIYWLYAAVFLLVPLFGLQALIVHSNGKKWSEFIKTAVNAMLAGKGRK